MFVEKKSQLVNKSFTLIEVLIAVGVLVIGIFGILGTYAGMFLLSDLCRDFTLANNVVSAKMEEIRKRGFDNLTIGEESFNISSEIYAQEKVYISNAIETPYPTDLKKVRVVVCFKSRGRLVGDSLDDCNSSPVELVTLISK
ncbi:MAG: hypothetical protein NC925_01580 [Candidatus Omnitrophica bacterium]|nr:hypothetical protein [Candidatus Omnitrophota bacterium]